MAVAVGRTDKTMTAISTTSRVTRSRTGLDGRDSKPVPTISNTPVGPVRERAPVVVTTNRWPRFQAQRESGLLRILVSRLAASQENLVPGIEKGSCNRFLVNRAAQIISVVPFDAYV